MCPTCALSYAARVGFRSNDSDPRHAPGESARVRPLLRPAARSEGRVLSSAHCPHCQTRRFFSRGDIDRRAFQRAPPPSATGVREAPPKTAYKSLPVSQKLHRLPELSPGLVHAFSKASRSSRVRGLSRSLEPFVADEQPGARPRRWHVPGQGIGQRACGLAARPQPKLLGLRVQAGVGVRAWGQSPAHSNS